LGGGCCNYPFRGAPRGEVEVRSHKRKGEVREEGTITIMDIPCLSKSRFTIPLRTVSLSVLRMQSNLGGGNVKRRFKSSFSRSVLTRRKGGGFKMFVRGCLEERERERESTL